MKKIRRIIIMISLAVFLLVGAVTLVSLKGREDGSDVTEGSDRTAMDEYLLETTGEKAPERTVGIWIKDGTDGVFSESDEDFKRSLAVIDQSVFSEVYVSVPFDEETQEESAEKLSYAVSSVKEKGKKAYVAFDFSLDAEKITEYSAGADGIIIIASDDETPQQINELFSLLKEQNSTKKLILCLPLDYKRLESLELSSADRVQYTLKKQDDYMLLSEIDKMNLPVEIMCCLDINSVDGAAVTADVPLKNIYELRNAKNITCLSFNGLKKARINYQNCFGAVRTYITTGIVPELAFREVGADGYSGETVTVPGYTAQIELYGSYLFPFILDGKNIGSSANGNITAAVDLKAGENSFKVKQNSSSLTYKMQSSAEEDIVSYIIPQNDIYLLPSESFDVTVVAHCNAEIFIKIGTQKIEAKCDSSATGFTSFSAVVTAPKSEQEIASLGSMSVIAVYGDKTVQYEGAKIYPATVTPTVTTATALPPTTLNAGNYTPAVTSDPYAVTQGTTVPHTNPSLGQNITYTGNLMCVVKEPYADVKLLSDNDNYSPACSPLAGGTMDYVVAESTYFNPDEGEEEFYYDLASGRKVRREAVDLVSTTGFGNNSLEVKSVISGLNKLQITLKTTWRVPYNIDYPGQNYYYSYKKNYNVTSFNADTVRMTFYHTTSATGSIDVSGSNVLSSASWSSSDKTVTLNLKLKNAGEYYGSSLEYDAEGNMVITVNRKPSSETGYVVLLDPGHGGAEPGAVGLDSAVQERQINLDFAYKVKAELESRGVTVYMTRTGNDKERDTLTLDERKQITRQLKPDLYVSIHCNGSYNPESIGTSTYYYEPYSYNLAKNIYDELLTVHKNHLYAGRQELYSQLSDKVQFYPFSVTRVEDCPSTLIEVGYLTNDAECSMLAQPQNQELFGKAIANGIYKTLTS